MEWIDALYGETVGLDSAPLIYFIERHPLRAAELAGLNSGVSALERLLGRDAAYCAPATPI